MGPQMKPTTLRIIFLSATAAMVLISIASIWTWRAHAIERDKKSADLLYGGLLPSWCPEAWGPNVTRADVERESFPHSGDFATSTDFFLHLVTQGVISCNINYCLFALSGVKSCNSTNAADFRSENNAWCVTLDCHPQEGIPDEPFLFSRNLDIERLDQASSEALLDITPYGKKGVLVLYPGFYGSRVQFLTPDRIATEFNPTGATNPVLRP